MTDFLLHFQFGSKQPTKKTVDSLYNYIYCSKIKFGSLNLNGKDEIYGLQKCVYICDKKLYLPKNTLKTDMMLISIFSLTSNINNIERAQRTSLRARYEQRLHYTADGNALVLNKCNCRHIASRFLWTKSMRV